MTEYIQFHEDMKMGIKDDQGRVVIPAKYDFVSVQNDGVFVANNGSLWGYLDATGRELFPFTDQVETYCEFSNGLAAFRKDGLYGYINKKGEEVIRPQFQFAEPFSGAWAVVRGPSDLCGVIDTTGQLQVEYKYFSLVLHPQKKLAVCTVFVNDDVQAGLIDMKGQEILAPTFASIKIADEKIIVYEQLANGDFREGVFLWPEKKMEWNNNMDAVNQERRLYADMTQAFQDLIDFYFKKACPCRFPRFRYYVEQSHDMISFVEGELLARVVLERFKSGPEEGESRVFECPVCEATYTFRVQELNAFNTNILMRNTRKPKGSDVGAQVQKPIPVVFGYKYFEGDTPPDPSTYTRTDLPSLVTYLQAIS